MHVFLKSKRQVSTTSNVGSVMNEVFCKIMKKQKISGWGKTSFLHSFKTFSSESHSLISDFNERSLGNYGVQCLYYVSRIPREKNQFMRDTFSYAFLSLNEFPIDYRFRVGSYNPLLHPRRIAILSARGNGVQFQP